MASTAANELTGGGHAHDSSTAVAQAAWRISGSDLDEAFAMHLLRRDADLGKGRDAGVDRCRGAAQEEVPPRDVVGRVTLKQVGGDPAALARPVRRRL